LASTVRLFGTSTMRTILGAFVADILEQRQLLLGDEQLGDLLDQLRDFWTRRGFR
jgi:hypothetical protein